MASPSTRVVSCDDSKQIFEIVACNQSGAASWGTHHARDCCGVCQDIKLPLRLRAREGSVSVTERPSSPGLAVTTFLCLRVRVVFALYTKRLAMMTGRCFRIYRFSHSFILHI